MADDVLLEQVSSAAEAALAARATGAEPDAAASHKLDAVRAALEAGHEVTAIAEAQLRGERVARERIGAQVLRSVERLARRAREATEEYEGAIVQAVGLGLAARDIAARAGVSHGTVAAVARRHEQASAAPAAGAAQPEAGSGCADAAEHATAAG